MPGLGWMGPNTARVIALCNPASSGVERHRESILSSHGRSPDANAPFAANNTKEIIDHRTIARELGGPLVDEPHSINPRLLSFGNRCSLTRIQHTC